MREVVFIFCLLTSGLYGQSIINTSSISHDLDSALSLVVDVGADFSRGNSSVNDINSSFGIGKSVSEDASVWILGGFNQLAVDGTTQQQASYAHFRANYEIKKGITLNSYGQYQTNTVLDMDSRSLAGINLDFDFGKDGAFMLGVGVFNENELYGDGTSSNLIRGNIVGVAQYKSDHFEIVGFGYFQPAIVEFKDFRCIGELSLRFPLSNSLQLAFNTALRFDSSPHSNLTTTDLGVMTSLRYELHNN
mgnify:CR=1 FL=1|jgi:hypothetical protein